MRLTEYLQELQTKSKEQLIQPELKQHRQEQDKKLREEQDLASGAVLQAVVEEGEGDENPGVGDLVFVHVDIANVEGDALWSSRASEGGSGAPLAFLIEKGARAPRGWEISLKGMHKGGRMALRMRPSYGFAHPECKLPPPPGVPADQQLSCQLHLVDWVKADTVRACGFQETMVRRVLKEGGSWESARPPFEVTLHVTLRTIAYDGIPQTGQVLYSTAGVAATGKAGGSEGGGKPMTTVLGQGHLPPGVEEALGFMCRGEQSLFIIAASALQPSSSIDGSSNGAGLLPPPPPKHMQLEVELELVGLVQVRDMTGTGEVLKRRVRDGEGEFPIDCALNDTAMKLHYRVRPVRGGVPGPWAYDSRAPAGTPPPQDVDALAWAGSSTSGQAPLELDTGCGEAPEALEMAVKLMVPHEVARVWAAPGKHGYEGRSDGPPGISGTDAVEFEVELVSFEKEGHWQVMPMEERFELAERVKAKANELVKAGKHKFARARYDRILRLMESTRDWETQEEVMRMDGLKLAVLSNMALCALAMDEPADAVVLCDKALQLDENNTKVLFRRGRALGAKGDYDQAEETLQLAAKLDPSISGEVEREIAAIKQRARLAVHKQKTQFKNFFDRS